MSSAHEPPGLPEVHDEAGDSPRWLPMVGGALLLLAAAWLAIPSRDSDAESAPEDSEAAAEIEAEGDETEESEEQPPSAAEAAPVKVVPRVPQGRNPGAAQR